MKPLLSALTYLAFSYGLLAQSFTQITTGPFTSTQGDIHSVYMVDIDNNYTLDLFVGNGSNNYNYLFLNNGDSTFTNNSNIPLISQSTVGAFAHWGDLDNDCDLDVYLPTTTGISALFENDGTGSYNQKSSGSLASDYISSVASPWADFNNDGHLDIVVANRLSGLNYLYKNNGNGSFTRIDTGAIATSTGGLWTASWGDIENDGDADLFLGNYSGNNYLLVNKGGGYFELDSNSIVSQEGMDTRSGSWGDYNNDGFLDLFVGRIADTNFLYKNNGDGTFTKITNGAIVTDVLKSGGSAWADLDNDGDLDLYATHTGNGIGSPNRNIIYRNNGNGSFTKITSGAIYSETRGSIGIATADFNDDGFLDIVNANRFNAPVSLFYNDGNSNNFLKLRIYGNAANKMAIGARVEITSAMGRQMRYINDESRRSINYETHFGLGQDTIIDTLKIHWPGAGSCVLTQVPVNAFYNIGQAACALDSVPAPAFQDSSRYLNAFFTNESKGVVSAYHWDFGDGDSSTLANPSHTYAAPGFYEVTLTVYDNFCRHRVIKDSIEVCPDTSRPGFINTNLGRQVSFTDTSVTTAYDYLWDFGDNSTSTGVNPVHTFSQAGTYNVCLTLTDSCRTKQVCRSITVCNDTLIANYGSNHNGLQVSFSDSSVNASTVSWDFGDGSSSNQWNPTHTYAQPGYYFVCMTVQDICTSTTYCDTIEVCLDTAKAAFNYTANNLLYRFSDTSSFASSYFWDFGDGNFSTQKDPVHIFQNFGTYRVCLTVTNDCYSDSICQNIIVCNLQAQAAYTYAKSVTPLAVQFTDQSTDAIDHRWDFGDGSFSTNPNPVKVFSQSGVYNVCLSVTDSCGQQDSTCKMVDPEKISVAEWTVLDELEIFPNPVDNRLVIRRNFSEAKMLELELLDLSGRKVLEALVESGEEQLILDLQNLSKGTYLLRIKSNEAERTVKITKS